jgi:hypothetical protein
MIVALALCAPSLLSGPHTTIAIHNGTIAVTSSAGDRAFTSTKSTYDATTLKLLSVEQSASCCGFGQRASATRNSDGTFDVRLHVDKGSPTGGIAYDDRNPHLQAAGLAVADVALVPWIYAQTHVHSIDRLVFNPIGIETVDITELGLQPGPSSGVPPTDRGLQLAGPNQPTLTVWYDPCTFAVDSAGWETMWPQKP